MLVGNTWELSQYTSDAIKSTYPDWSKRRKVLGSMSSLTTTARDTVGRIIFNMIKEQAKIKARNEKATN